MNHEERIVRVSPAPRGKKPSWGGFVPQHLGFDLCQQMKDVLTSDAEYPFADQRAMEAITEWRSDLGELLQRSSHGLQEDGRCVMWWTFAGGRINHTLKYALEWTEGWKVVADNFSIRINGNGVSIGAVKNAIEAMATEAFWDDETTREKLLTRVPEYRLSKFQRALPPRFEVEMVGAYLLDFDGATSFLQNRGSPRSGA